MRVRFGFASGGRGERTRAKRLCRKARHWGQPSSDRSPAVAGAPADRHLWGKAPTRTAKKILNQQLQNILRAINSNGSFSIFLALRKKHLKAQAHNPIQRNLPWQRQEKKITPADSNHRHRRSVDCGPGGAIRRRRPRQRRGGYKAFLKMPEEGFHLTAVKQGSGCRGYASHNPTHSDSGDGVPGGGRENYFLSFLLGWISSRANRWLDESGSARGI